MRSHLFHISLVIMRLIQKKTNYMFTHEQIITFLKDICCSLEFENIYLFNTTAKDKFKNNTGQNYAFSL